MRFRSKRINQKQLFAVQQCIQHLKDNCNQRGLFINYGSRVRVRAIVSKIQSGDPLILSYLKKFANSRECATALNIFLRNINKPLLPKRVQNLILGNNYRICPRIIALDSLNLLAEDLKGADRILFLSLMDLMKTLSTVGSLKPTELRVSHAPYLLMPLLFPFTKELQEIISKNWKSIADILNEMVLNFNFFLDNGHFHPSSNIFITSIAEENQPNIGIQRSRRHPTINDEFRLFITRNYNNSDFIDPTSYVLRFPNLFPV